MCVPCSSVILLSSNTTATLDCSIASTVQHDTNYIVYVEFRFRCCYGAGIPSFSRVLSRWTYKLWKWCFERCSQTSVAVFLGCKDYRSCERQQQHHVEQEILFGTATNVSLSTRRFRYTLVLMVVASYTDPLCVVIPKASSQDHALLELPASRCFVAVDNDNPLLLLNREKTCVRRSLLPRRNYESRDWKSIVQSEVSTQENTNVLQSLGVRGSLCGNNYPWSKCRSKACSSSCSFWLVIVSTVRCSKIRKKTPRTAAIAQFCQDPSSFPNSIIENGISSMTFRLERRISIRLHLTHIILEPHWNNVFVLQLF